MDLKKWRLIDFLNVIATKSREKTRIALTFNSEVVDTTNASYKCYYEPWSGRVYFRCGFEPKKDFPSNTAQTVTTIPEAYRPKKAYALSIQSGSAVSVDAVVGGSGNIQFKPEGGDMGKQWIMYIAGWWDID